MAATMNPTHIGVAGVAAMFQVCTRTVRQWDASGAMPRAQRIRRVVRWSLEDLRAWAEAGCPSREEFDRIRSERKRR